MDVPYNFIPKKPLTDMSLLCSICLDVFTDPVTTPCGHNFCKTCLSQCCNQRQCPLCKENLTTSDHKINTALREVADRFRRSDSGVQPEILCDACIGTKQKALKSCLNCVVAYCRSHLEAHYVAPNLKRHTLVNPTENLQTFICQKHEKPLELFCKFDQTRVCQFCTEGDHRNHSVLPIDKENESRKSRVKSTQVEVRRMIQDRQKLIDETNQSVALSKKNTEKINASNTEVFSVLIHAIEKNQTDLLEMVREGEKTANGEADQCVKDLQQEITALLKRENKLEKLLNHEEPLQLLQIDPLLCSAPPSRTWNDNNINSYVSTESLSSTLSHLQKTLNETLRKTLNENLRETDLRWIQQYAVDVMLDRDTAQPNLILSDDGKQVKHADLKQNLPYSQRRFDVPPVVVGRQGFNSGRFYYEVLARGKTDWVLGLVSERVERNMELMLRPQNGFWTILLNNGNEYRACAGPSFSLALKQRPQKIGVFVGYEEGRVSFYDVETRSHIYSFTGQTFTEKIYPFFGPGLNQGGRNSAPLIISSVKSEAQNVKNISLYTIHE